MTETGHVLFLDLVGYSRLSVEAQAARVTELLERVRATRAFQCAEQAETLIPIATGDGVALVFLRYPTAPLECAVELARTAAHLPLRMGIHVGPITRLQDINGALSVTGGGINLAKRVMDLAGAGEIFLSDTAAALVQDFDSWQARLSDQGERTSKHGERLRVWALDQPLGKTATFSSGGGVPLHVKGYVMRPADSLFAEAVARQEAIVLVKGPRQVGKTSLLARGLHTARQRGAQVAVIDFQALGGEALRSAESLYRALAESLADQLELESLPVAHWSASRAGAANLERYLRRVVFAATPHPLVLALDEADRLFSLPFGSEFFGLLRSWHNRRSLDPDGPWHRLTVAVAYALEAHLFITDPNQSPFNVGVPLTLSDFTPAELVELAQGSGADVEQLHAWLGGQPFLCRRALDAHAASQAPDFSDHLERLFFSVSQDPTLTEAVRAALTGKPCAVEPFFRLRASGVLAGESASRPRFRCALYEEFLRTQLG